MMSAPTPFNDIGNGCAVVFLHGFPFNRSMWREQIDFLSARGYRCIVPDLRGLGENKFAGDVATTDDMARDIAVLMDDLEIESAVICGLSMGGYVAFEFANLFPARVKALVLAGTRAPADNEQEKQGRLQQIEQMLTNGMSGIAEASLPKLLALRTRAEKPEVVARLREMIVRANPFAAAAAQRGMAARRDYSDDLPHINIPALIIVGREDPIRPLADAEFMHEGIRNSRLEIIEDAAHMTNMEQPEVFNRMVVNFLRLIH
jgi:3-oxoadipate enol-lactonase